MAAGEPSPFAAGLRCRCPRCGQGKLFDGLLKIRDRCQVCGLDLRAHDTGDGPAAFLILILGAIDVIGAIWVETALEPPFWVHIAIWPLVTLVGTIGLMRPMKATMVALQYRHRSTEHDV
jgi:uncharacterized protein (DUF983 family)